jgi:hypothetical protein
MLIDGEIDRVCETENDWEYVARVMKAVSVAVRPETVAFLLWEADGVRADLVVVKLRDALPAERVLLSVIVGVWVRLRAPDAVAFDCDALRESVALEDAVAVPVTNFSTVRVAICDGVDERVFAVSVSSLLRDTVGVPTDLLMVELRDIVRMDSVVVVLSVWLRELVRTAVPVNLECDELEELVLLGDAVRTVAVMSSTCVGVTDSDDDSDGVSALAVS